MTRVLHVTRDFPPRTNGGISTAVGGMVRVLRAAGTPVAVVSFDGYRPRASGVAGAPERGEGVLRVAVPAHLPEARAFARSFAPQVVHVHHGMLWDFAAALGVPCVATIHVAQAEQNRLRGITEETLSLRGQRALLAGAHRVLAPSQTVADLLVADEPSLASRLRVSRLAADAPDTVVAPNPSGPILYAGRFADINGIAELFEVATRVDARFVVAGGLPDNPKSEARWRGRAPAGVELTGWLGRDDLEARYAEASIVVVPSWFETFGLVALEAMHRGRAIVATTGGALAELLEHDRTALLSAPRDIDGLVANLDALVRNPERARELGAAAAEQARAHWCWEQRVDELLETYATCTAAQGS